MSDNQGDRINLELRKFVAPEILFGAGSCDLAGAYAEKYNVHHPLVVTDNGVLEAKWTERVIRSIQEAGFNYSVFSDVSPNPRDHEVTAGVEMFKSCGCDSIIAVGGGSVIDCAKGIGISYSNQKNILEFEGVDKVVVPMPPLICIPTTSGTSADVSQFAIINDTARRTKIAIISKSIVPDIALIDPITLTTMDPYLTACTGMDALVHAIEAFVSNGSSMMTDTHAIRALELISANIQLTIDEPDNMEARGNMMMGSLQAGLAFSNASLGAVHAMAHSLGGFLDLPHGECNAILLPGIIDFNHKAVPERFQKIGEIFKIPIKGLNETERKKALLNYIMDLRKSVGIVDTLGSRNLKTADIPDLANRAIVDPCLLTNPRDAGKRDLETLYEESI